MNDLHAKKPYSLEIKHMSLLTCAFNILWLCETSAALSGAEFFCSWGYKYSCVWGDLFWKDRSRVGLFLGNNPVLTSERRNKGGGV